VPDRQGSELDGLILPHILNLPHVDLVHARIAVCHLALAQPSQATQIRLQDLQDHAIRGDEALGHSHDIVLAHLGGHTVGRELVVGMRLVFKNVHVVAALLGL